MAIIGLCAGCESESTSPAGVVGVFGGVGLGPGDFSYPRAIAAEPGGCVFVVDKAGRVQRFNPEGQYETGWRMPLIESGKPIGLTVHPDGRIFIADTHYSRVMVYDRDGNLLTSFGKPGIGDGEFQLPTDVAVDAEGFLYVSEYYGNDRITKWSPDLQFVGAFGTEPVDGVPLRRPAAVVVDREQTLWVADACNHRLVHFTRDGEVLGRFGGFGSEPGRMRYPYGLCLTPRDELLVSEYEGNRLQWFSRDGRSLRVWGKPGRAPGELNAPWSVCCGANGRVYVLDSLNSRVQIFKP
ncbi:MAG TPA: 6-bladed beta-propeller [Phycisphaerae bacterium]|nr:6-bladed beta-propeller [Phycisphaerae bacterium]